MEVTGHSPPTMSFPRTAVTCCPKKRSRAHGLPAHPLVGCHSLCLTFSHPVPLVLPHAGSSAMRNIYLSAASKPSEGTVAFKMLISPVLVSLSFKQTPFSLPRCWDFVLMAVCVFAKFPSKAWYRERLEDNWGWEFPLCKKSLLLSSGPCAPHCLHTHA